MADNKTFEFPNNVKCELNGHILTMTCDLSEDLGYSASKKNKVVATTGGNQMVPGHQGFKMGINIFKQPE